MPDWYEYVNILNKWLRSKFRKYFKHLKYLKGQFSQISNWKYCSTHFWNAHVTDINMLIFWISDFITFVQVWLQPMISRSPCFRPFICQKIGFNKRQIWSTAVHFFQIARCLISKILMFSVTGFITYIQIWFEASISRRSYLRTLYFLKGRF